MNAATPYICLNHNIPVTDSLKHPWKTPNENLSLPEVKASLARSVGSISDVRIHLSAKNKNNKMSNSETTELFIYLRIIRLTDFTHVCKPHECLAKMHILDGNFS